MSTYGIFTAEGTMLTFFVGKKSEATDQAVKIAAKLGLPKLTVKKI
jgi:hypothetical protein